MADERRKTVRVACTIVNGVELRLYDDVAPPAGRKVVGDPVRLQGPRSLAAGTDNAAGGPATITDNVDAEWFDKWAAQNAGNPLLLTGAVKKVED